MATYSERLCSTLIELVGIPSTSGHEEQIRDYLTRHLTQLGLTTTTDEAGNLIATFAGEGRPLLLNAHMDRVPPGHGHTPVLHDGILYSDGTTNLGADDAAGLTIILEIVTRVHEQQLPHPPLVLVFTVQEETGLCGARNFVPPMPVTDGIVFDNAFEAGVVVSQGATYEAFDVTLTGRTGHPGKDLASTINALDIFRATNYPHGSLNNDQTRINIGRISAGTARNAVPALLTLEGELRSFAPYVARQHMMQQLRDAFEQTAQRFGGHAQLQVQPHAQGYTLQEDEPLLQTYRAVLAQRDAPLRLQPTFIVSDTSSFRPDIKAFTLSTGVMNEHSFEEYVALAPLEQIVQDMLQVLQRWH